MELWYPGAIIDPGNDAGPYTDLGEPKGLLHTTEGQNYLGARGAYVDNNSWPHATCSFELGFFQIWQHNPINVASRALKNLSGGVETNRDNVVQLEIVGTADRTKAASWGPQYVENFPTAYLDGIRSFMRWSEAQKDIPRACTVMFKTYPESYGNNGVRLTGGQWDAYTGWLGHMHAPENSHGDPGLINMAYLLSVPTPPIPEDDMKESFVMYHENGTFWEVGPNYAFPIDGDTYQRMINTLHYDAVAPVAAGATSIVNGHNALTAAINALSGGGVNLAAEYIALSELSEHDVKVLQAVQAGL